MGDAKAMKRQIWRIPSLMILIIACCLSFSACLSSDETKCPEASESKNIAELTPSAQVTDNAEITATATAVSNTEATATTQADKQTASDPSDIFSKIPHAFIFLSGAGAWETSITINQDGTFSGNYTDDDMGDTGKGYPNGTRYRCNFNGKFTDVKKISDKEYSMRLEYLHMEGTVGKKKITEGVRVITSEPAGFDNAGEFRIYLPGRSTVDLSEEFLDWMPWPVSEVPSDLPLYGLYNVAGEEGFFADGSN